MIGFLIALGAIWIFHPESLEHPFAATLHYEHPKLQRREVYLPIQDFSLTDQRNQVFRFGILRGKIVLVAFAYTTCPDVCPLMTAAMLTVQRELSPVERDKVHLLTVTTDPEVDSPAVLAAYARRYGADVSNWSFLTGNEPSLARVWKNFGVGVKRIARGLVDHTPLTAVIDRNGVMRFGYYGTAPDSNMVLRDMRSLLSPQ